MSTVLWLLLAVVAIAAWYFWRRSDRVPCTLELESSHEHLHALLELEGFAPRPGDGVRMEPVPEDFSDVPLNHRGRYTSRAVVYRASLPKRLWTRLTGGLEFKELFEVGFE
jgi:hypothetical protein